MSATSRAFLLRREITLLVRWRGRPAVSRSERKRVRDRRLHTGFRKRECAHRARHAALECVVAYRREIVDLDAADGAALGDVELEDELADGIGATTKKLVVTFFVRLAAAAQDRANLVGAQIGCEGDGRRLGGQRCHL